MLARSAFTGRTSPLAQQPATHEIQIRQREHRLRFREVLGEAAVAHLREAPQALHHVEGVLATRPRARSVDQAPALAQRMLRPNGAPVHAVANAARLEGVAIRSLPIRPVPVHHALGAVQQLRHLRDVGDRRMRRRHVMHPTLTVGPDVELHAEVEIEPLMQEVDPQHRLQRMRRPAHRPPRIVRLDPRDQAAPRDHRVHLGQKPLPARHLALLAPRQRRERPLLRHRLTPAAFNCEVRFAEVP